MSVPLYVCFEVASASSSSRAEDAKPSWYKSDEDMVSEDEYDEDSFLKGKIAIVRRSVDRELPHRRGIIMFIDYTIPPVRHRGSRKSRQKVQKYGIL